MKQSCAHGSVEHLGDDSHVTLLSHRAMCTHPEYTYHSRALGELWGGASGGTLCGYCSMAVEDGRLAETCMEHPEHVF